MFSAPLIFIILTALSIYQLVSTTEHKCKRKCALQEPSMVCQYEFNLEMYASMSNECAGCPSEPNACFNPGCIPADGLSKALYLINRQLPGPVIEVCKGDRIIVDLRNHLPTETTSIHWHGLHHRNSPFMDGVPFVTQCPVPPGSDFRYDFVADREGSYMWHSHSNDQRGDGMFGALVVRAPLQEDPLQQFYERDEHIVIINDWSHELFLSASIQAIFGNDKLINPHTILVNGLARNNQDNYNTSIFRMPSAVFDVENGYNYRFRFMHAGVENCPIEVSIDNHMMLVVSSDARNVEPLKVDSIRMLSGERYDVIISATQPVDNYWIRFQGKDGGSGSACDRSKVHQVAILRYKGAPEREPTGPVDFDIPIEEKRKVLNPYNNGQKNLEALSILTLNSLEDDDITSVEKPSHKYFIAYGRTNLDERLKNLDAPHVDKVKTRWQLNHINFKMPPFPLLTETEMVEPNQFCNYTDSMKHCLKEYCNCIHTLNANLNSVVELIIVDEGTLKSDHPMHLHGYHFRVVAMEKINKTTTLEEVKRMDEEGKIKRKLSSAPLKDTATVPSGGYTVLRFHADNPGYWLFHCHYEIHMDVGMALLFKVGEHQDFVKPPPNFHKCITSSLNHSSYQDSSGYVHHLSTILLLLIFYNITL